MRDDDGDVGRSSDLDGLVHRLDQLRGFVAHVGGVNAAILVQRLAERDHLIGRRRVGRRIVEAGRQADGAVIERGFERSPHRADLGWGRRAVEPVHGAGAQGGVADLARRIERGRVAVQRRQIAFEAREKLLRLSPDDVERRRRIAVDRQRREADAAIAGDHRGDALADLAFHQRIAQQRAVVVGVGVDEPGRQRQAVGLDFASAFQFRQIAHRDDAIVLDREIAAHTGVAAAVDQQRVADDKIGLGSGVGRHGGSGRRDATV